MIAFLKLIRINNLLIIAFTQYLIRYALIKSQMSYLGIPFQFELSDFYFFLLVLSTMLIAAAGYMINDYFDVKTDKINRPETVVIDNGVKRRWAMVTHLLFNIIGIGLGVFVGWKAGNFKLGLVHLISAGLLWHYSTTFKKQLIVGNLIVSLLTAMVPLIVMLYDIPPVFEVYSTVYKDLSFANLYKSVLLFSLFAFLVSFIREIIKDMQDYQGDLETGCETMPIVWGFKATKAIVISLISNTILLLSFIVYKLYNPNDKLPNIYIVVGLILPLLFLAYKMFRAQTSKDYYFCSILVKLIMLVGVLFSLVIYYLA